MASIGVKILASLVVTCLAASLVSAVQGTDRVFTLAQKHAGLGSCDFDKQGNSYCTERLAHCIWKTNVTTGEEVEWGGTCGKAGNKSGHVTQALFNQPWGLCVTPAGDVVVADSGNSCIRIIDQRGEVDTLAGTCGMPGQKDGDAASALFNQGLREIICLQNCSVVVDDGATHALRLIDVAGGCVFEPQPRHHSWLSGWGPIIIGAAAIGSVGLLIAVTRVSCSGIKRRLAESIAQVEERIPLMADKRRRVMEEQGYEEAGSPSAPPVSPREGSPTHSLGSPDPAAIRAALLAHAEDQREDHDDRQTEPDAEGEWARSHVEEDRGTGGNQTPALINLDDVEAASPHPLGADSSPRVWIPRGVNPVRTNASPEIVPTPVRSAKDPFGGLSGNR